MPLFFMHIHDGGALIEDFEGEDFPDAASAIADARVSARESLAEKLRRGDVVDGQRIEIYDDSGNRIAVVRFADQMTLPER